MSELAVESLEGQDAMVCLGLDDLTKEVSGALAVASAVLEPTPILSVEVSLANLVQPG